MRRAILHLGFHKTGTTFLQRETRRWVKTIPAPESGIFFSSQHVPESGWMAVRTQHVMRLRNRIARAALQTVPQGWEAVCGRLASLGVDENFRALRKYLSKSESVLVHSDENSLGSTFGHPGFRPGELWPFYPNGEWLCAVFAAAALASYGEVHLVLSLRRFDEMGISSLKDAVRSPRPLPALDQFSSSLLEMPDRCRQMIERVLKLEYVSKVHVLDHELLRRSPEAYFRTFVQLTDLYDSSWPLQTRRANVSWSDEVTLDKLVERGALAAPERAQIADMGVLLTPDVMRTLAEGYERLRRELIATTRAGRKLVYYC